MKCFLALACVTAVITCFSNDATGKKPHMVPDKDTLVIDGSSELRIECYSDGAELRFSFPEGTFFAPQSKKKIWVSDNGTYTFLRESAKVTDTGWYACAKEDIEINNNFRNLNHSDEDIRWIYVYVNRIFFYPRPYFVNVDPHSLVAHPPKVLTITTGSVIVVPCRVTSPTTNIQLLQNSALVDLEAEAVWFDPKIGFVMKRVAFVGGEANLRCYLSNVPSLDTYILRYANPRPTMITDRNEHLILQEGETLRIECFSATNFSFLFPKLSPNSSSHEIVNNENGTSTFLRRSVVPEDTGWYGCAGLDIRNNYIPFYSIEDTREEISWIYAYVNSSVSILLGFVDRRDLCLAVRHAIIPCRPTLPGLRVRLYKWVEWQQDWRQEQQIASFDPKIGFVVDRFTTLANKFRCEINEPVRYVTKDYSLPNLDECINLHKPVVSEMEDSSASEELIIRMTGENLHLRCEWNSPVNGMFSVKWKIPITVSPMRPKHSSSRTDIEVERDTYWKREVSILSITNVTKTDSGEYICSIQVPFSDHLTSSRRVKVLDKNEVHFVRLHKLKKASSVVYQVVGREGGDLAWMVDVTDFPSTEIKCSYTDMNATRPCELLRRFRIITAVYEGAPQIVFTLEKVGTQDRKSYFLHAKIENEIANVTIHVDVQVPPSIQLVDLVTSVDQWGVKVIAMYLVVGLPRPNVKFSFLKCPKFPSQKDSTREYFKLTSVIRDTVPASKASIYYDNSEQMMTPKLPFWTNMSGIVTCKACNEIGCSKKHDEIRFSASPTPYFTSTNLRKSEITLTSMLQTPSLTLECYASGEPYPNVIWFKDNMALRESKQLKFEFDNRELTIVYSKYDDGGRYSCRAENEHGHVEDYIDVTVIDMVLGVVVPMAGIILVTFVLCVIMLLREHVKASKKKAANLAFERGAPDRFDPEKSIVDQAELLPYDPKWEYPRGMLKLGKTLGSGAFGIVKKGEAKSICRGESITTVAVKLVFSKATLNFMTALRRELKILAYLGKHPNIVNLLGACTRNDIFGELYVIVEYCRFGDLRHYLLNNRDDFNGEIHVAPENLGDTSHGQSCVNSNDTERNSQVNEAGPERDAVTEDHRLSKDIKETTSSSDDSGQDQNSDDAQRLRSKYHADYADGDAEPISEHDLVYWSWQISRGMDYLGKRKIVHGDLATRNVLLADNNIVKICDFGLAKNLYKEAEYRDNTALPLPVKWMSIEAIKDRVFSVQSDVWSFGIVMWEIFTLGETPYPGISNRGLCRKLVDGYRMGQPKYATSSIYDIMTKCWDADPTKRPSFADSVHNLGDLLDDGVETQYLNMQAQYMDVDAGIVESQDAGHPPQSRGAVPASEIHEHIEMNAL